MQLPAAIARAAVAAAAATLIAGCGGGGGSSSDSGSSASTASTTSASDVYPTSVAVGSPTSVVASSSTVVASAQPSLKRRLGDWWLALVDGVRTGDPTTLQAVLRPLLPLPSAHAAPQRLPEAANVSAYVAEVAAGRAIPTRTTLPLDNLFKSYQAADCFGPRVSYQNHDFNGTSSGELPGGDLGLWKAADASGTPCAAAQLNKLMEPVKSRANASFILGARLAALALADGGMPAANTSKDLGASFGTFISDLLPPGVTLAEKTAGVTNNGSDSYTYQVRLKFTNALTSGQYVVAFKITHTKTSATAYSGVMQYASSNFIRNASNNCTGQKTADVGTLRYEKNGDTLKLSAREGPYCVTGADEITASFSSYVALDANGELDHTKTTGATPNGWDQEGGGFKRFAATLDPSTQAGDYLFAWQAGIGDSHSRMFAAKVSYNTTTEVRDLTAYFGFGEKMATNTQRGKLLGMICNWAGPGSTGSHTPQKRFQSQSATLAQSATTWAASGTDKIAYAPTDNCSSGPSMRYDVNADGTIAAGEGASVTATLDAPTGTRTEVFDELASRSFTIPAFY